MERPPQKYSYGMVATAGRHGYDAPVAAEREGVRDGGDEGGELLEGPGKALLVVAVEPGGEAFLDDGVVVLELHDLGFVHLPQLVVGQVAAGDLHLGQPLDAEGAHVIGRALDAVDVAETCVGVDDRLTGDGRVGGDLGDLHAHRPARPRGAVGDHRDAVGGLERHRVADALLVDGVEFARSLAI